MTARPLRKVYSIEDLRHRARRRMPRKVLDVVEGGSSDDITVRANRAAFERIWLRPRALHDVSRIDLTTTVLGEQISMPLMLAPCSMSQLCDPGAELAIARAAGRAGTVYAVPGGTAQELEKLVEASPSPLWYQLYLRSDVEQTQTLVDRVAAAGYRALCVTIDTVMVPYRETDLRNGIALPLVLTPGLIAMVLSRPRWAATQLAGNGAPFKWRRARQVYSNFADTVLHMKPVTWRDIAWLRERWQGPLVVKGVMRPDEVPAMIDAGVDGIVVSNHGGRNLDGLPATIDVLPEIVEAVAGRAEVFLDSGVRRGTDVVKALALGATAVFVGRPYLYGLAANGEAGVEQALELLRNEIQRAMAFSGAASVAEIDSSMVRLGADPLEP